MKEYDLTERIKEYSRKIVYTAALGALLTNLSSDAYSASSITGGIGQTVQKKDAVRDIVENVVGGFATGLVGALTGVRNAVIGDEKSRKPLYTNAVKNFQKYFTSKGRRKAFVERQREDFIDQQIETYELVNSLQ